MSLELRELPSESIVDATAYWLYGEDEGWERWRLVSGSQTLSRSGQVLRLGFELEGETFEVALIERDSRLFAKFDQRDDPERELPAYAFRAADAIIVQFIDKDDTIFLHVEIEV